MMLWCTEFAFLQGFEAIDPFVPVEVPNYSEEEACNLYDYYKEKMWIATEAGHDS